MRIISDAYQHLGNKLLTEILGELDRPAFHWCDMWYEQTEFPEIAEGIDYPAVFLDFASENITTAGELLQNVGLLTNVYVAVENLQDTHIGSPEREGALHYFELLARVHEMLQAYDHPSCGNLNRIAFVPMSTRTNVIVYRLTYASQVMDTSVNEVRRVKEEATPGAIEPGTKNDPPSPKISTTPVFDI
jgi:hypothetical protein